MFAATDPSSGRLVLIALNFEADRSAATRVSLAACGAMKFSRAFQYSPATADLKRIEVNPAINDGSLEVVLPASSMTVLELDRAKPTRGTDG